MNSNTNFYDEVLAMLNDGKEMTDIAKHITESMNKAQADFNAAKKASEAKARKVTLVGAIYDAVQVYMQEFAPDLLNADEDRNENITFVVEGLDAFIDTAREAKKLGAEVGIPKVKVKTKSVTAAEADSIIKNWLKALDF